MGPVNYNTQFLIRADGCILTENPPGEVQEETESSRRQEEVQENQ